MFKIESYVTPILLSYVDKYVKDFKPADAQVSLWGGGVVLHNLVLKTDVLQQEVNLPFTLVSGRIHELLIQVPWTKIMSEPIIVNIDTIECILSIRPPSNDDDKQAEPPSHRTQVVEAPPGYMQALVLRIVNNIAVRVHHLIVKYVQDDIILSLNVKHLSVDSTGTDWQPAFADIDQEQPAIRRLIVLDDLTLCLDSCDSDGKIRFYQDPLLYRCRLEFRALIKLVSAHTRRASAIDVQLRSKRLAWGVTSEQILLLLRLIQERTAERLNVPADAKLVKTPSATISHLHSTSPNQAEPARTGSWSEWAWSWMPSLADRPGGLEEAQVPSPSIPITVVVYLDDVSLSIKLMELEAGIRKRTRSVLEIHAAFAAFKANICMPTTFYVKLGIRVLNIKSFGKCPCGHVNYHTSYDESTVYLRNPVESKGEYKWPESQSKVEIKKKDEPIQSADSSNPELKASSFQPGFHSLLDFEQLSVNFDQRRQNAIKRDESDDLWKDLDPLIFLEYNHERSPPNDFTNPYENPPSDFEYSDWVEECYLNVSLKPIEFCFNMDLIHRLKAIQQVFNALPKTESGLSMRVLTVEECDALIENLPQRRINLDIKELHIRIQPWDHSPMEEVKMPLVLDIEIPKGNIVVTMPLYPNRVCSAAGQMPEDEGPLWRGARIHVTAAFSSMQASICSLSEELRKPCVRADLRFVVHMLMHPEYFVKKQSVLLSFALKIREANVSGSAARLLAVSQVVWSLMNQTVSMPLRKTTLAKDALHDEELVALDVTLEDFSVRGYVTKKVKTSICQLQAVRATAIQSFGSGEDEQAWLFNGPDTPTNTPFVRIAMQWCSEVFPSSLDYLGVWSEPAALSIDPLFVSWLAYRPLLKPGSETSVSTPLTRTISATTYLNRRKMTPPPSSRAVHRPQAEQVHMKARSSSSEPSEKKDAPPPPKTISPNQPWWKGEGLLKLYDRLNKMFITTELGLVLVYITTKTASAVDCATVRLAMDKHVSNNEVVLVFSVGRWSMYTSNMTGNLWHFINHEGPTYVTVKENQEQMEKQESFPWRMVLADMSCYALESGLRAAKTGQLKATPAATPRTVLEHVSTTVTLSVAKKYVQHKIIVKKVDSAQRGQQNETSKREIRAKYFTVGGEFKPTSLKEFLRGPAKRKEKEASAHSLHLTEPQSEAVSATNKLVTGPVVSLGFNLHIDTPPLIFRIEHDQVHLVSATLHCLTHVISLITQDALAIAKQPQSPVTSVHSPPKQLPTRSLSEMEETASFSESSRSETRSDLMTIFEARSDHEGARRSGQDSHNVNKNSSRIPTSLDVTNLKRDKDFNKSDYGLKMADRRSIKRKMSRVRRRFTNERETHLGVLLSLAWTIENRIKTFIWCQWVISTATIVISTDQVKLAFDMDDMMMTIDIQQHYNQLKVKIASAVIKQYERTENQWATGVLGGRVLEALEPEDPKENCSFLTVTITQARISTLPESWKQELHPKILEQAGSDVMWEVYAILAPLEIVMLPTIMDNIMSVANAMVPHSYCQPPPTEGQRPTSSLPFIYVSAGGLRVILNCTIEDKNTDDTFLLTVEKITLNPHPDNPICRRPIAGSEATWNSIPCNLEGRQYEIFIKGVNIRTARLSQLVSEEESVADAQKGVTGENPAVKWSLSSVITPILTPLLHPLDVSLVLAPALFVGGVLASGPAIEFNLASDCSIEVNIDQIGLALNMGASLERSQNKRILIGTEVLNVGVCPYVDILVPRHAPNDDTTHTTNLFTPKPSITVLPDDIYIKSEVDINVVSALDSGVETATSRSTLKSSQNVETSFKKTHSVAFVDQGLDASDHIEVFVAIGTVELSLYTFDDSSPEIEMLKPGNSPREKKIDVEEELRKVNNESQSFTETIRKTDAPHTKLYEKPEMVRKKVGNIPLCHMTLQQPNLYYWKRRSQKSLQVSLFDIWLGFGMGLMESYWHAPLLSTTRGVPDPVSDIPPALATMNYTSATVGGTIMGSTATSSKVNLQLDIERPVLIETSEETLRRLVGIMNLLMTKLGSGKRVVAPQSDPLPPLYKLRAFMAQNAIDSATVNISQLGLTGFGLTAGWDSASLQLSWNSRPDRVATRGLINSLLISAGPFNTPRQPVLQPLQLGIYMVATWAAWRRAEGGLAAKEPTVRLNFDVDHVNFDVRPENLAAVLQIKTTLDEILKKHETVQVVYSCSSDSADRTLEYIDKSSSTDTCFTEGIETGHHFYKDDLRSGAFKIVCGGQLPMAYQVMLHKNIVSWRYPHPRAITRLIAFPLPNQNEEIDGVLELYNRTLLEWEPHSYIKLPVNDPKEYLLHAHPPECVFATTWRFRVIADPNSRTKAPYEFNMAKFKLKSDSLIGDLEADTETEDGSDVTAEQLSGVLRVDSYFAPHLTPHISICLRFMKIQINIHNALPPSISEAASLDGYYVSKPLLRSHRVLAITAEQTTVNATLNPVAGIILLSETQLSSDILDCTTGTMERMVNNFVIQLGLSLPGSTINFDLCRSRFCTSIVHVAMHVPRLRTLLSLGEDWKTAVLQCDKYKSDDKDSNNEKPKTKKELAEEAANQLEGRVSLWIHNSCVVPLRIGQEDTEEVILLAPGVRLAYRWRKHCTRKRIRFALATPAEGWHWSNSIPFTAGDYRVRLETDLLVDKGTSPGEFVTVSVKQVGAHREMRLTGRLFLANMLRLNLLYKIREQTKEKNKWRTASTGELQSESVNRSIICSTGSDLVLKIKLVNHETGWSGDIPLKECPKENVPWLVKVPSDGDVPYISVWCRVVRARNDTRIFATVWPLYVLKSNLTLDTDVLLSSDISAPVTSSSESTAESSRPAPLIQSAPGRGATTHLLAPGTTSARHSLSFQYRNIESPVTRDAIPLHYGVTETSVFDKRDPINSVEELLKHIKTWLDGSGRNAASLWPYSIVTKHWPGPWQPALLQPRCEVSVQYEAVRAGGGCSLEVLLNPVLLMCNAAPITLTLRAHDAAPMCKLQPGTVISPPSEVLNKPFFMSIEKGRETFVSNQLEVYGKEPGRYGTLPPGKVAIDYPITFAIPCHHKVAIVNLNYEIKENINVLGVTSSFVFFNKLDSEVLMSPVAALIETNHVVLAPKDYKTVQPSKPGSTEGKSICRFWLQDRWRGGEVSELRTFICLASPFEGLPAHPPVPVLIGTGVERKGISLMNSEKQSLPVVVTQHKHEGRWIVTVAKDPCPQYVVQNHTTATIALAQPKHENELEDKYAVEITPDCPGAHWWLTVAPGETTHYSSPSYTIRHPMPPEIPVLVPFLTFAKINDEEGSFPLWCPPVAVADGEQLVQLSINITLKLRVRSNPHSTLIQLRDVDQNDISASDIRRRLLEQKPLSEGIPSITSIKIIEDSVNISRVNADEKLFVSSELDPNAEQTKVQEILKALDEAIIEVKQSRSNQEIPANAAPTNTEYQLEIVKANETFDKKLEEAQSILNEQVHRTLKIDVVNPPAVESSPHVIVEVTQRAAEDTSSSVTIAKSASIGSGVRTNVFQEDDQSDWSPNSHVELERVRCVIAGVVLEMAAARDTRPLVALHIDRAAVHISNFRKRMNTTVSVADVQIDNVLYENGQFDFAVIATTRAEPLHADLLLPLWTMFADNLRFDTRHANARLLLKTCHDSWTAANFKYSELTEVDVRAGPLALYIEDAYVTALADLFRLAMPPSPATEEGAVLGEAQALCSPLRLHQLAIHPLDITLTLHTAVRMYIALDQSPLNLSAFRLNHMFTSTERLAHALTVHYLSAAILGAGWVVGGLELLGAPGALAARVGGASGGVRAVAAAAAAALLRSLSAWAGSLARNLDLLGGDEEHARRAAAARRRPPDSFVAGLFAGITNFAINILGAVGGLAHHPLVGVAVGETESSAAALRRGLVGALTKPLSATADLVAYAGHGLLKQTGWDPVPQPRSVIVRGEGPPSSWSRECVRWTFRMADLIALGGFQVLIDENPMELLLTHKFLLVVDPETELIVETIDLRFCTLKSFEDNVIKLSVQPQKQLSTAVEKTPVDEDEYRVSAAAMARVARYTGTEGAGPSEARIITLHPDKKQVHALLAALRAAIHHNSSTHFPLL